MKLLMKFILVFLLCVPLPACAQTTNDVVVTVDGMTCEACVQSMTKIFTKEETVDAASVSLEEQEISLDTKEGQTISDDKIKELVEWGGYDLKSIKRN